MIKLDERKFIMKILKLKHYFFILVISMVSFSCSDSDDELNEPVVYVPKTYIPDDKFEQRLINLGYDDVLDDSVATANIDTITYIPLTEGPIADMTGIEDFTAIEILHCGYNTFTNLNVTNNINLTGLYIPSNNNLTSLELDNPNLKIIDCWATSLINLDVSNCPALEELNCNQNLFLTSLNLANGYNENFTKIWTPLSSNLTCIQVDDTIYSNTNWTTSNFLFGPEHSFSEDCY